MEKMNKYSLRKNSTGRKICAFSKKVDTLIRGKLILAENAAGSVVTKADTRHRDSHPEKMNKCLISWGKRGARLAGLEPAA